MTPSSTGQSEKDQLKAKKPEASRLTHEVFRQVHDASAVGVLAITAGGGISYANPAVLACLGLQQKDILGRLLFDIYQDAAPGRENEAKLLAMAEITDQEFLVNKNDDKEHWALISTKAYRGNDGLDQLYLFIRDISAVKKKEKLFSYLNKAAEALATARDTQTALDQIAHFIVPTFASWFTIDVLKDNKLELLLLKHKDPAKMEWARQYRKDYPPDPDSDAGSGFVLKTGKPGFVPVITEAMIDLTVPDPVQLKAVKQIGLQSVILLPVYVKDTIIGVANFILSEPDRHFDETDLEFAINFASFIGLALENTRLNEAAQSELIRREQSEEQFRFLTDAIPHKVWTSAPDGRATYYNRLWHDYAGINGFEALRSKIWDIIHPDDRKKAEVEWPLAIKQGRDMEVEQRFRRHDGQYRWHLTRFSAHKNDKGEIMLWVGTSTDIHEQKVAHLAIETANNELSVANNELGTVNEELTAGNEELAAINEELAVTNEELNETQATLRKMIEDLAASESRFRFLLNAVPQQVWTATPDGALNYVNDVVSNDFGYTAEEIVGHGWQKFIHPDDLVNCLDKWVAALTSGKEYTVEFRLLFKDGTYRWHLGRAVPLIENGDILLWIGTNTNIELQKANEQKKDEFLSIASHELKTPLTNIKAFNQLLQRVKDPERQTQFVTKSSEHIRRLERLIADLLDVTKINAGKMSYRMEPFDFGEMIAETVESARLIEQTHEIILDNQANIAYTGDRYRLEQVLNNFISNAVKYSPGGNRVIVRTKTDTCNIVVSVEDFGIGITPGDVDRLFDRYYRVDNTAIHFDGLGLGLFICSEILKRHHGSFWIESEPGKGSTFFFGLPLNV
jgi:PAS domain S-box-containing protein